MTLPIVEEYTSAIEKQLEAHQIVTFKWVSRKFNVHSTVAKQLLNDFAKDKLNDQKYSIIYSNFGKTKTGELMIWLSEGGSIDSCNNELTIMDRFVFSIALTHFNFNAPVIYNEDKLIYQFDQINLSSINHPEKINRKGINRLKSSPSPRKKKDAALTERSLKESEPGIHEKTVNKEKSKVANKIISLLTASKSKTISKKDNVKTKYSDEMELEGTNSILTNDTNGKQSDFGETIVISPGKKDCDGIITKKEVNRTNAARSGRKTEENSQKEKPLKTSRLKKKLPRKKLKRIKAPLESSSNSENSDNDSDFTANEEPDCEHELPKNVKPAVPETAPVITVQGKKRKRKVIEKNVAGENGFFYTEKEVVYVSCDSGDEENILDENTTTSKRTKIDDMNTVDHTSKVECKTLAENNIKSQKAKMKQSSIVNFFKKP